MNLKIQTRNYRLIEDENTFYLEHCGFDLLGQPNYKVVDTTDDNIIDNNRSSHHFKRFIKELFQTNKGDGKR